MAKKPFYEGMYIIAHTRKSDFGNPIGIPENDLHRKMTPKQKSENDLHMNFVQMQNRKMTSIYFLVKFSKENDPQNKIGK